DGGGEHDEDRGRQARAGLVDCDGPAEGLRIDDLEQKVGEGGRRCRRDGRGGRTRQAGLQEHGPPALAAVRAHGGGQAERAAALVTRGSSKRERYSSRSRSTVPRSLK